MPFIVQYHFTVRMLSKYTSNVVKEHWNLVARILRYLKPTVDYRLHFTRYPIVVERYNDVIWNSDGENSIFVTA